MIDSVWSGTVHDDSDFVAASRLSVEIQQINVHEGPREPDF
ncbi:hypothetical protein [Nocardia sp. CA-290969]